MKRILVATFLLVSLTTLTVTLAFQLIFEIPRQPKQLLLSRQNEQQTPVCYNNSTPYPISEDGYLNLLVWNIYKQNHANWEEELDRYSQKKQLLLLQEVSLTDDFKSWVAKQSWGSNYVSAFSAFDIQSGVLNLATQLPSKACAYLATEPWLRLPKSGLFALYLLDNGQTLAVVNVHAINFTLGVDDYKKQLTALREVLAEHSGPIIMAGDFNTWSVDRETVLKQDIHSLNLQEVIFDPDYRTKFINGQALDHVFYRGLELIKAEAPETSASDHNPLLVSFKLLN